MLVKHVAAWVALALSIGLVFVALLSHRLPGWWICVGAAGAFVARRAVFVTKPEGRCPKCQAYAARVFAFSRARSMRRYSRDDTPDERRREENPPTGWSETSYRCGDCKNEWVGVRVEL
jgi:hypothetical protein